MSSTRTLIAFAYVADQFAKTNDIAIGLAPLFAPLISKRAEQPFNPEEFIEDVKNAYDIDMHPYVAEELAPALAKHGFLVANKKNASIQYINSTTELPEPPIKEEQLQTLINEFTKFSKQKLRKLDLNYTDGDIEKAFLDRLVKPEFLTILLRPDDQEHNPTTLSLRKSRSTDYQFKSEADQRFDYLVASYILHLNDKEPQRFELLVAATSGSLVSEVVLNLSHPLTDSEPLDGIHIAIDTPLILDALDLGPKGSTLYAKKLIEQLEAAGAIPVVFEITIEEIKRVLSATLRAYDLNQGTHGPLAQRIRTNHTLAAYVRSIIPKVEEEIGNELKVRVYKISDYEQTRIRTAFTEVKEIELRGHLAGSTTEAIDHDSKVVATILRLRGMGEVTTIRDSKFVFATRNFSLSRNSRRFLEESGIVSRSYFPPCITDRHLAGLIWISSGGSSGSISRLRLIANCSAAIVPRRDLVQRMHRFFEELNPSMARRFEALMTNERAENFLMDRTLSDVSLVTQENYEDIYRDIEDSAATRVTEKMNKQIADIEKSHAEQMENMEQKVANLENKAQESKARSTSSDQKAKEVSSDLDVAEKSWLKACHKAGDRNKFRNLGILAATTTSLSLVISLTQVEGYIGIFLIVISTLVVSSIFWLASDNYFPNNPLSVWIKNSRKNAILDFAKRHEVEHILNKYGIDCDTPNFDS